MGLGLVLGVSAAVHANHWQDRVCILISLVGVSMPSFWLALMLMLLFAFAGTAVLFRVDQRLLYLFPFAVTVLYMSAFFHDDLSWSVYSISLIPLLVIPENDVPEFKKLLVSYYEGEDPDRIMTFLKNNCWKTIQEK